VIKTHKTLKTIFTYTQDSLWHIPCKLEDIAVISIESSILSFYGMKLEIQNFPGHYESIW
jgi:hypothetical protein